MIGGCIKINANANQRTGIKSSKSNFFPVFSFQLSKVMTVNSQLRMADSALRGQAFGISGDLWLSFQAIGGSDPVSVDTCAVAREPHPPACPPADLGCLTCEQDPRSSNAFREQQVQAGGQTMPEVSEDHLKASAQNAASFGPFGRDQIWLAHVRFNLMRCLSTRFLTTR